MKKQSYLTIFLLCILCSPALQAQRNSETLDVFFTTFFFTAKPQPQEEGNKLYEQGKKQFQNKKYTRAFPLFEQGALLGNAKAQIHLAMLYLEGTPYEINLKKAHAWANIASTTTDLFPSIIVFEARNLFSKGIEHNMTSTQSFLKFIQTKMSFSDIKEAEELALQYLTKIEKNTGKNLYDQKQSLNKLCLKAIKNTKSRL